MLRKYPGFRTRDPDVNRSILVSDFSVRHFDCATRERPFLAKANWAVTKYFRITSAFCSVSTDTIYDASPAIRQFIKIGPTTRIDFEMSRTSASMTPSAPIIVVPADRAYRCKPMNNHAVVALRIEVQALADVASAMLGVIVPPETILAEPWNSDRSHKDLARTTLRFIEDLDELCDANSAAADILGQALLVRFLLSTASDFGDRLRRQMPAPSGSQLKRIEEYIAGNWEKGIDIKDIADVFGISTRTIFRHFKSQRGVTPLDFLRKLKLERARAMLQKPGEKDNVFGIALRCGFQGMGHFANEYYKIFGELPSETLRRARTKAFFDSVDPQRPSS